MSNTTLIRSEQQDDLLQQLEMAGVPLETTNAKSLGALKSNSRLAEETLDLLENGGIQANFMFSSAPAQKPSLEALKANSHLAEEALDLLENGGIQASFGFSSAPAKKPAH